MKTKLKILAISDTHLGEDVSLLSYPQGCQHLWRELRKQFGYGLETQDRIDVDELILIGDIPDRALSSTAEIMTATANFIQMLGSVANVKKGVYIPGNHDHTIWTEYLKEKSGMDSTWGCTGPKGDRILKNGRQIKLDSYKDLLAIFFGFPYGSSWLQIEAKGELDFVISNPLYSTQVGNRTYVFTHGSHFKKEVTDQLCIKGIKLLDGLDRFVGIEIESGCDVTNGCDLLEELEKKVAPFIDSLWISSKNNPTSQSDRYWYLLKLLASIETSPRDLLSNESKLFSYEDLKNGLADGRIRRLSDQGSIIDKSIERWNSYFLPQMVKYLRKHNELNNELTFVYGDTHTGGWGEIYKKVNGGSKEPIRVYNTGGWTAHHGEGHPACHIFAVDDEGKEYMLDVSFNDIKIGSDLLIELARIDAENNTSLLSNIPKGMIDLCKNLGG
jgi:hypothetical protein